MHSITDIFFDWDHTIYDFDQNASRTFSEVFGLLGFNTLEVFLSHFNPINEYYWQKFARNEISRQELRYIRLKESFDKINQKVTDETIEFISSFFLENLTKNTCVFEGAEEILIYLSKKYRLHIITNGPQHVQQKKLENTNLLKYFTTVTTSELANAKKPELKIFQFALEQAKTSPTTSVMVGDNLTADIQGALNAGMNAIYFNPKKQTHHLEIKEIQHLLEIKKIL